MICDTGSGAALTGYINWQHGNATGVLFTDCQAQMIPKAQWDWRWYKGGRPRWNNVFDPPLNI